MKNVDNNLGDLAHHAMTAARTAAGIILSHSEKPVDVREKRGGNSYASQVVTEVDLLCEKAIIEILAPTCDEYDLALLTEESTDDKSRLKKDFFWCIDPMDGTLSFIEDVPGYAVSIALVSREGKPVIGVVLDPVSQVLYCAVKGNGVTRNGEPWSPDMSSIIGKSLTMVCDRGFPESMFYMPVYKALESIAFECGYSGVKALERNGAVLNACYVLENPPAVYFKFPKPQEGGGSLWDFAATAAIFTELGFIATDFYGKSLDLNRADSSFMNHRGVIYALDPLLAMEIHGLVSLCMPGHPHST